MYRATEKSSEIQYQALLDLSARARGGIFIYIVVWFTTALWVKMPSLTPVEFYFNSACIVFISLLRITHLFLLKKYGLSHTNKMYNTLVVAILLIALYWGVLSSWVMFFSPYEQLKYPYMVILSAFGIGGTTVLSISRKIASYYPFLIFVPSMLVMLLIGGTENHIMSLLCLFSMAYVVDAARSTRRDYEAAVHNRILAEERSQQLKAISITDELTGLKNRKYFSEQLLLEWRRCSRTNSALSILMYDLDHFKKINDEYGHLVGDDCLRLVGDMLAVEIARETDTVARYGGEEFIIILPNTNIKNAASLAERLVKTTHNINLFINGEKVIINCSIGVASAIPDYNQIPEKLISSADKALYQAKSEGRNRFYIAGALET